jgi:SAM-dependent methyltransferase
MSRSQPDPRPPPRRFAPGSIDYNGVIARHYQGGRALSGHTAEAWRAAIAPFVRPVRGATVLDVGSGTGRFAGLLARAFAARVIGLEPAVAMLAVAVRAPHPPSVGYVAATAEDLPLPHACCDVAWLSHVFHHVRDRRRCADELRRVLRPGGRVLLRGTFGDRLDGFPTLFRFFPGAREICAQLPSLAASVAVFEAAGFARRATRRVRQRTCTGLAALAERTRLRADTALALLPDRAFRDGQAALEDAARLEHRPSPVFETLDLLVLESRS